MARLHHSVLLGLVTAVGTWGCGASDETASEGADFGAARAPFSTAPGEPNHEQITASGLSFLRPEVLEALQAANAATDVEFFFVNANHFDDCNFSGGSDVVRTSQAEAVGWLDPNAAPGTDLLAIPVFARSLHALQDFYAHTNWVEQGATELVDDSLGAFPELGAYSVIESSGLVVVQGRKPKHAALTRDDTAPYPESAIVHYKLGRTRAGGLISGTVDYEAGDFCPASVAMSHAELNKDKSTNAGRLAQFEAARGLAIRQTEHEWCRLRARTRSTWGEAGVAKLDAWVSAGAATPACE